MSEPSEKAKAPYLLPEDALAYERFLDWSLGGGFKLALIERRHPEERKALVAWTLERVPGAKVAHLEEGDWMRGQIEAACGGEKAGEVPLLIVAGLEDAAERERACAQLNVERDELARDFGIPWVLITHPAAVLELQQRAPDFCDFVGLWLGDSGGVEGINILGLSNFWGWRPGVGLPADLGPMLKWADDLLVNANQATDQNEWDRARDLIATYDLKHPGEVDTNPVRMVVMSRIVGAEWKAEESLRLLERAVAVLKKNGALYSVPPLLVSIAMTKLYTEDLDAASHLLKQAVQLAETTGNDSELDMAIGGQAEIAKKRKDIRQAYTLFNKALRVNEKTGNPLNRGSLLLHLGMLELEQKNVHEARKWFLEALELNKAGSPFLASMLTVSVLLQLGALELASGNPEECRAYLKKAIRVKAEPFDPFLRWMVLLMLGMVEEMLGRPATAQMHLISSKQQLEKLTAVVEAGNPPLAAIFRKAAQEMYEKKNSVIYIS